ncbi:MAG: WecB/TagA/CpsF family glycosyltransferase [Candidatus Moraniibacteriota bacterium]
MNILGVKVDNLTKKEILEKIRTFLVEPKFHQIATINPEFILEAQKNLEFKNILNNCDLNVADGFGIKLAFWRFGKKLKARFTGADLMLEILKIASEQNLTIFLAVNKDGLSTFEETKDAILKIYPDLIIEGIDLEKNVSCFMFHVSCHVLFCNFGAPQQELFINSQKCDTIRLAMGVGGSFDFLTGKVRRAPKFLRLIGLEWLWRLILQPKRWKRIFNATIIFSYKILFNKE